jgi:hypothetical protein
LALYAIALRLTLVHNRQFVKEPSKFNIRYVGFESLADGARRLDYAITSQGEPARYARIQIPASAFSGPTRVTFQESATICYERLRRELETLAEIQSSTTFTLTDRDIEEFRPRKRAAGKKA